MQINRVYFDIDMRMAFQGLKKVLKSSKINSEILPNKSFIIFMNKATTKFKILVGTSYLVYYSNGSKKFPLDAIQFLPEFFNGEKFDVESAVMKSVKKKMGIQ